MRIEMRKLQSESGMALVAALTVTIVLLALTGVVLSASLNVSGASNRDTRSKRAFEAAQAGLQATLYRLNTNINSQIAPVKELEAECIGGENETVQAPSAGLDGGITCPEYKTELSSGVYYKSWTTKVFEGVGTCAGVAVGTSKSVAERCVTVEGIVEQGGQIVKQRVQERIAAFDGKPQFSHAGVTGEKGVVIANTAQIKGPIYTNGQLEVQNSATGQGYGLGPSAASPKASNGATISQLGSKLPEVNPWEEEGRIPPVQETYTGSGSSTVYTSEGDRRISNAFITCVEPTCKPSEHPADAITKDNNGKACAPPGTECGWDPANRTLKLKSGWTWYLAGSNYNFCSLLLNGTAKLATTIKTVIYIDSPQDSASNPKCPAESGYFQVENSGSFVNLSPGLQCEPTPCTNLAHDTTALQINVFGPSNVANSTIYNNACAPSNITCVSVGGNGEFWGTIYAPFSDVAVLNPGTSAGAVVGATVTFNNKGTFLQDRNVTKVITTAALGTYYRTAWHQCDSSAKEASKPMSNC
jgi:Tfp pilus assembly protein PilX